MKILNSNTKNFDKLLENLLSHRKKKIQSDSVSVSNIIKDVKKNGDKALLKYEKKFNQNNIIIPSSKQIKKSINSLDKKVKKAIDTAYNRIYKFHSLQKFKNISYTDKLKNNDDYEINLIFNNNAHIALTTEAIEVRLDDQNEIK